MKDFVIHGNDHTTFRAKDSFMAKVSPDTEYITISAAAATLLSFVNGDRLAVIQYNNDSGQSEFLFINHKAGYRIRSRSIDSAATIKVGSRLVSSIVKRYAPTIELRRSTVIELTLSKSLEVLEWPPLTGPTNIYSGLRVTGLHFAGSRLNW